MRGYRKERVASLVHEIVSEAILRRINDPRVSPLTTVTRVQISGDLTIATVYLSILDDPAVERRTITALRHAGGFIQRMIAKGLDMRQCPELRFELDEIAKKVRETMQILDENRRREPHLFAGPEAGSTLIGADKESGDEMDEDRGRDQEPDE